MRSASVAACLCVALGMAYSQGGSVCAVTGVEMPPGLPVCPYTGVAPAQAAPQPVLSWSFETDPGSFVGVAGVTTQLCTTPGSAKDGSGCLLADFSEATVTKPDEPPCIALMNPPTPAAAVAFWAKSPAGARLALLVSEADGSLYWGLFALPRDRWQRIVMDLPSLSPSTDNHTDENGQLDLDQVAAIAILDFGALGFAGAPSAAAKAVYLDDFALLPEPVRKAPYRLLGGLGLGEFAVSAVGWTAIGGDSFDIAPGDDTRPWVARLTYQRATGVTGVVAAPGLFGGKVKWTALQFDARTELPTTLGVLLVEDTGGEYAMAVQPQTTSEWQTFILDARNFGPSEDKPDYDNLALDTDKVNTILILDFAGVQGQAGWGNTLEIARPIVVPATQ